MNTTIKEYYMTLNRIDGRIQVNYGNYGNFVRSNNAENVLPKGVGVDKEILNKLKEIIKSNSKINKLEVKIKE